MERLSFYFPYFTYLSHTSKLILILWSGFLLPHLSLSCYIIYKDLTKQWDQFRLVKVQNDHPDRICKYLKCLPYVMRDFCIIFPLFLYYYINFNLENLLKETIWTDLVIKTPFAYLLNRLWAMLIHWLMHKNIYVYKFLHQTHHVKLEDLCCLTAWMDTIGEFIFMEIPGAFCLGLYFLELNWLSHLLIYVYVAIGGTIDHCGYQFNTFFNSIYHFNHHKKPNYNFAEFELYDKIFGTLYVENTGNKVEAL